MNYTLTKNGGIKAELENGSVMFLPPEHNGTPEWRQYQEWLDAGNTPEPAPPPPPPAPDYVAFWDALLISPVYQVIRNQALTTNTVLVACTEFIAAISDAKAGRPNVDAIQACINLLIFGGTFSEEDRTELQTLLNIGNLDEIYTIP